MQDVIGQDTAKMGWPCRFCQWHPEKREGSSRLAAVARSNPWHVLHGNGEHRSDVVVDCRCHCRFFNSSELRTEALSLW